MPAGGFLARSTAALLSTSVLTSALGFVYWALAARLFPATVVGGSATAIAAMNLVAPFTNLGLGTLLLARLPAMAARRTPWSSWSWWWSSPCCSRAAGR